ncbi:TonB family protein [Helicobacter sp. MIT 21-1697]|uniref:TonB family protein n=1 Tax=Helicobacter sp. MIT 21-1697 TaxID=2993733 RepID=UPI00224AD05D|nr:TonB family protein [Helicobacter sp. MIT 21-1697]MCX2716956.1 TonB family protein [Helicobacter sp. MIT 21-1697]
MHILLFQFFAVIYALQGFLLNPQREDISLHESPVIEQAMEQEFRSCVMARLLYPKKAVDDKIEGVVEIMISFKNSYIQAQITSSSGYKVLDMAALRAVKKSNECLQNLYQKDFKKAIFLMPIEFRLAPDSKRQDIQVPKIRI